MSLEVSFNVLRGIKYLAQIIVLPLTLLDEVGQLGGQELGCHGSGYSPTSTDERVRAAITHATDGYTWRWIFGSQFLQAKIRCILAGPVLPCSRVARTKPRYVAEY